MKKTCTKCNKEKDLKAFRKYRNNCRKCEILYQSNYRNGNKLKISKQRKQYKKEYYKLNKNTILIKRKEYYRNNKDKILARMKEYQHNNLDKFRVHRHKREALQRDSEGSYTEKEWLDLCESYGNICLRCKKNKLLTVDHVIPITKKGTNYISNIQPLCRGCNSIKGTNTTDYREEFSNGISSY